MKIKKVIGLVATLLLGATGALVVSQQQVDAKIVTRTNNDASYYRLYTVDGNEISNRGLAPKTDWAVGRIFTHNNETYYQVATNEYLKANESEKLFDDANESLNYTPNIQRINEYFMKYINALHVANNVPTIYSTPELFEYANLRAYQQVGDTMNHDTDSPLASEENLYGFGYSYILKYGQYEGMTSDRDVAYYLLKGWYDDNNNASANLGEVGHFGHRAELIYSGSPASLGMSDNSTAFEAKWNPEIGQGYWDIYNYTGSNPDTNFVSKDAVAE